MLTAFHGVPDDIEYTTQTGVTKGVTVDVYRDVVLAGPPAPGQRQVQRTLFAQRTPQVPALTVSEDSAVALHHPAGRGADRAGPGHHGLLRRDRADRLRLGQPADPARNLVPGQPEFAASTSDISAVGGLSPADLARGIAKGYWQVVGRTRLEGQPAIELNETGRGPDRL